MGVKNKLKEIRMKEFMMNRVEFAKVLDINYKQYVKYEKDVVPLTGPISFINALA